MIVRFSDSSLRLFGWLAGFLLLLAVWIAASAAARPVLLAAGILAGAGLFLLVGISGEFLSRIAPEVVAASRNVEQLSASLQRIASVLETQPAPSRELPPTEVANLAGPTKQPASGRVEPLKQRESMKSLFARLKEAQKKEDAGLVLDVREILHRRISVEYRAKLDEKLAAWLSRFFQSALRKGRACEVADDLRRSVEVFGAQPAMSPLVEAFPLIMQGVEIARSVELEEDDAVEESE